MTPAKQEELFVKYPSLFVEVLKEKDPEQKPWPIRFGISCSNGWFKIIDELCALISSSLAQFKQRNKTEVGLRVVQIKEKFGGLRFYYTWSAGNDVSDDLLPKIDRLKSRIEGAVQLAENLSLFTCELCAAPAECTTEGWYHTTCEACVLKNKQHKELE